jgi:hypothetical protein
MSQSNGSGTVDYATCPNCYRLEHPDEATCRACGTPIHPDVVDEPGRHCPECGADVVGNDPHAPGCSADRSAVEYVEVDGDEVVRILAERGIEATVAQTGGGTATLFAGPMHVYAKGDPTMDGVEFAAAAAGPGWFEGPAWTRSKFSTAELSIGHDDPYGEDAYELAPVDATATVVADLVEKYVRADAARRSS